MSDEILTFFSNFFREEKKTICNINFINNFFKFPESYKIYDFSLQKIKEEIPENVDLFFLRSSESVNEDSKIFFYIYNSHKVQNSIIIFPTHRKKMRENWERYIHENYVKEICHNSLYSVGRFVEKKNDVVSHPKICICSLSIGEEYRKKVDIGIRTKKMYCIQHDYDFRDDEDIHNSEVGLPWNKILLILKCLQEDYDYVVWMDADTLIMNQEKTVNDIVNTELGRYDMLVSYEYVENPAFFNSGVMFFRKCDWIITFLQKVFSYSSDSRFNGPFYDQPALNFCYSENLLNAQEHIKIAYNQKLFNSYWFQYTPGDFILHLARCEVVGKLQEQMELYCPYRKREETEEEYKNRLKKHIELKENFDKKQ